MGFDKPPIAIDCPACGFTDGHPAGEGVNRCAECGRYASADPDVCCLRHEIRSSPYPSGTCPRCEQERRIEAERREASYVGHGMHPSVDARRF